MLRGPLSARIGNDNLSALVTETHIERLSSHRHCGTTTEVKLPRRIVGSEEKTAAHELGLGSGG